MRRLLFITKDVSIEDAGSALYRRVTDLRDTFSEVHIILIKNDIRGKKDASPERLFENTWRYTVEARTSVGGIFRGYETAVQHLVFGGSFRADVIVADDTHEEGMLGWLLGKKFHRPFQLQIQRDFFDEGPSVQKPSFMSRMITDVLLTHTKHVSVATSHERDMLALIYDCPKENIEVLPSTYVLGIQGIAGTTCDLRARFPKYESLLMYIPPEKNDEHTLAVLQAFAKILKKYPNLGLLIIQGGPERLLFERSVIALGIQRQVVFEVYSPNVASYIQTVDMLVHFGGDKEKEKLLAIAGMVRVPVIADVSGKGNEFFHDWESAYLCAIGDTACVATAIETCLYNSDERARLTRRAHEAVQEYFKQDYNRYLTEYTKSINTCVVSDSSTE
jgi:glycosyltransferase involved in cell wall biosynthesis